MIFFGDPYDRFYDVWEAAAAAAALGHDVEHGAGHDQLPTILIEHFNNNGLDILVGDNIAAAN